MTFKCECKSCYFEFELPDDTIPGEVVPCPDCGADLEVTSVGEESRVRVVLPQVEDWGE